MIFYRIKQFYLSLTAKVSAKENSFVQSYLDMKERKLFFNLQVFEQKHCINVAYDIDTQYMNEDKRDLIRLALLHDIGKTQVKLTPIDKSVMVLLDKFTQGRIKKYNKWKKVHCYYNHGEIGYELLQQIGGYDKIFLQRIRDHHCEEDKDDEILKILQKWDNRN